MSGYQVTTKRETKETSISVSLDLSGRSEISLESQMPFLDHLLHAMAFHGGFGLRIHARCDVEVDPHHGVEDIGISLGDALASYLTLVGAVARYGHAVIPMDDALSEVTIDVGGRPFFLFDATFPQPRCGEFDVSLLREFLHGLANRARINLHAGCRYGLSSHHMAESLFKALGRAIKAAFLPVGGGQEEMSTKGHL